MFTFGLHASLMSFYNKFSTTKPMKEDQTDGAGSASRPAVVWSAHSSPSVHLDENRQLPSVEVRLIMAMDEALQRKRRVDAGERVNRDAVEWWRGARHKDGKDGKVVVHPTEKRRDRLVPYHYPKLVERPPPLPVPASATPSVEAPPSHIASVSKRVRRRAMAYIKRVLLWLLLFFLVAVNLLVLIVVSYLAMKAELPRWTFPSSGRLMEAKR